MQLPPIRVHNKLTGQKEEFRPLNPPRVNMYVCGITPYSTSHFGHGMSAVAFDMVRRYLIYRGYHVRYVQNFTDIDDKIINRAHEIGEDPRRLPERYIDEYLGSLRKLNVMRATVYPLASGELDKIVELIEGLIKRGHAYIADGDVYFRVASFEGYGKLSGRTLDDLMAGARVEVDERKEDPADFALWKAAKPGEPTWSSPWSDGRPGWHIECSAMAMRYLGEQIDIHGGGQDLVFPHHENEIAQSESFTDRAPFARYWMHNGFILFNDEKMSKSLGNTVTLTGALEAHDPMAVRLFLLQSHYRSPLNLSDDGFEAAERGLDRLRTAAESPEPPGEPAPSIAEARAAFIAAMDDDFNAPGGVAALFDLAREANRGTAGAVAALRELADVLGLHLSRPTEASDLAAAPFVDLLIEVRRELRAAKQFQFSDTIRDRLTTLGIAIEDRPGATTWRKA